jgi:hypothetical protein
MKKVMFACLVLMFSSIVFASAMVPSDLIKTESYPGVVNLSGASFDIFKSPIMHNSLRMNSSDGLNGTPLDEIGFAGIPNSLTNWLNGDQNL